MSYGLTHRWHLTKGGRNMKSHAIISKSPVITGTRVLFDHDTINAEGLKTRRQSDGTVSNASLVD